jgi:hypothetical protein
MYLKTISRCWPQVPVSLTNELMAVRLIYVSCNESIYRPIVKLVSDPFVVIMNNKISLNQIEHTNVSFAHIGAHRGILFSNTYTQLFPLAHLFTTQGLGVNTSPFYSKRHHEFYHYFNFLPVLIYFQIQTLSNVNLDKPVLLRKNTFIIVQ